MFLFINHEKDSVKKCDIGEINFFNLNKRWFQEILENAMDFLANDGENEETKGEKNTDFNNLETNLKLQR